MSSPKEAQAEVTTPPRAAAAAAPAAATTPIDPSQQQQQQQQHNDDDDDGPSSTPQREMNVVLDRIQQLESEYRTSAAARAARLNVQHDKYADLQTAVETTTKKYKTEIVRLRGQLRRSDKKQAVLARRLAQALAARNEDDASHLRQLVHMHQEQMTTLQEGMREMLGVLGVEECVIGNLEALCGVDAGAVSATPAEEVLYRIRRQNCELAIALRKSISIVREKLDVEDNARLEAQQRAGDFLDAANVVSQALQKAGAVLLKEERATNGSGGSGGGSAGNSRASSTAMTRRVEAVSVPGGHLHHPHQQHQSQHATPFRNSTSSSRPAVLFPPTPPDESFHYHLLAQQQSFYDSQSPAVMRGGGDQYHLNRSMQMAVSQPQPQPQSQTIATSIAVLKDIVFGSIDVVKDMHKIMNESRASLAQDAGASSGSPNDPLAVVAQQAASPTKAGSGVITAGDVQTAVDRARTAERAIAGQALLELRREVEAHQSTRTLLQRKVAFLSSQYEKVLHAVKTDTWSNSGSDPDDGDDDGGEDGHREQHHRKGASPPQQQHHSSSSRKQLNRHNLAKAASARDESQAATTETESRVSLSESAALEAALAETGKAPSPAPADPVS